MYFLSKLSDFMALIFGTHAVKVSWTSQLKKKKMNQQSYHNKKGTPL